MRRIVCIGAALALCLGAALAIGVTASPKPSPLADLPSGKVQLPSASALAFGPDGVLFVGDSVEGAVVAIDTGDRKAASGAVKINVENVDQKISALVGVTPDQILINDIKVNPISKNVYMSASRGHGPDAMPLIVRVDTADKLSMLSLDNAKHESVRLVDSPAGDTSARQNPRMQTITNMNYVNGDVIVAGLSNEEWSLALRSIPFPFKDAQKGATLQIWHSSYGRFETQAPIRTFVPYSIGGQPYILAAYTCTPLVKMPVSSLEPGAQVKGVEIADLGAGNQPLDMVPYKKDGHDYILISNTSRGTMKLKADDLASYPAIDSPQKTGVAGVPYDTMSNIQNVAHMTQMDASDAVILTGKLANGPGAADAPAVPMNLQTIALP